MAKGKSGGNKVELIKSHVVVWKLEISGYGAFLYVGTEQEAWDRAREKARWEGTNRRPLLTRHRVLTVNEARIYVEHGPDTLDGAPYYGEDE